MALPIDGLMASVRGQAFRILVDATGEHYQGLSIAARRARKLGIIDDAMAKKLVQVDIAAAIVRHLSTISVEKFIVGLTAQLACDDMLVPAKDPTKTGNSDALDDDPLEKNDPWAEDARHLGTSPSQSATPSRCRRPPCRSTTPNRSATPCRRYPTPPPQTTEPQERYPEQETNPATPKPDGVHYSSADVAAPATESGSPLKQLTLVEAWARAAQRQQTNDMMSMMRDMITDQKALRDQLNKREAHTVHAPFCTGFVGFGSA